jgi:hypothetical protein
MFEYNERKPIGVEDFSDFLSKDFELKSPKS